MGHGKWCMLTRTLQMVFQTRRPQKKWRAHHQSRNAAHCGPPFVGAARLSLLAHHQTSCTAYHRATVICACFSSSIPGVLAWELFYSAEGFCDTLSRTRTATPPWASLWALCRKETTRKSSSACARTPPTLAHSAAASSSTVRLKHHPNRGKVRGWRPGTQRCPCPESTKPARAAHAPCHDQAGRCGGTILRSSDVPERHYAFGPNKPASPIQGADAVHSSFRNLALDSASQSKFRSSDAAAAVDAVVAFTGTKCIFPVTQCSLLVVVPPRCNNSAYLVQLNLSGLP